MGKGKIKSTVQAEAPGLALMDDPTDHGAVPQMGGRRAAQEQREPQVPVKC